MARPMDFYNGFSFKGMPLSSPVIAGSVQGAWRDDEAAMSTSFQAFLQLNREIKPHSGSWQSKRESNARNISCVWRLARHLLRRGDSVFASKACRRLRVNATSGAHLVVFVTCDVTLHPGLAGCHGGLWTDGVLVAHNLLLSLGLNGLQLPLPHRPCRSNWGLVSPCLFLGTMIEICRRGHKDGMDVQTPEGPTVSPTVFCQVFALFVSLAAVRGASGNYEVVWRSCRSSSR